jgi:AcrR family transcriptional regulator
MLFNGGIELVPVKKTFTRDLLTDAAFKVLRAKGRDKLSTRSLARELNCSTMPIYSYLKSMRKLDKELRERATSLLLSYQTTPRTGEAFFDMGLGYILFARQERNLFRFLFGENERSGRSNYPGKVLKEFAFNNLIFKMKGESVLEGLDEKQLESILTKMWIFVHGIAVLSNNNALVDHDEKSIRAMLKETGLSIIKGERAKGISEKKRN